MLDELLTALAGAHSRMGVARACARGLFQQGVRRVILAWGAERAQADWRRGRWALREDLGDAPVWVRQACETGSPCWEGSELVLPLQAGYALLGFRSAVDLEESSALRLQAVIGLAHAHCRALTRVAATSRKAIEDRRDLERRLAGLLAAPELIATGPSMRAVLDQAHAVAGHPTPVLLLGASGTGKGLLARWIHDRSPRASQPFVVVNCGALPEALVESELFGHVAGAFTGAVRERRGRFERADGGTIFLDEIAELSPAAQVKLLHVLQDGTVEPVGGEEPRAVDVRVVAATHRSLEEGVRTGSFREDLYYRLSVFPLRLPPLRDRLEDLPALVRGLLERIAARLDRPAPKVSKRAMAELAARAWPGNVRQLANVLERSVILSPDDSLKLTPADVAPTPSSELVAREEPPLTFEEGTARIIARALRASGGKLYGAGGAAERLALNPSTLQTKMRKLGIRRSDFVTRP